MSILSILGLPPWSGLQAVLDPDHDVVEGALNFDESTENLQNYVEVPVRHHHNIGVQKVLKR